MNVEKLIEIKGLLDELASKVERGADATDTLRKFVPLSEMANALLRQGEIHQSLFVSKIRQLVISTYMVLVKENDEQLLAALATDFCDKLPQLAQRVIDGKQSIEDADSELFVMTLPYLKRNRQT